MSLKARLEAIAYRIQISGDDDADDAGVIREALMLLERCQKEYVEHHRQAFSGRPNKCYPDCLRCALDEALEDTDG